MAKVTNQNLAKQIIKWFWILFVVSILSVALLFSLIFNGYIGYMPPVEDLENPIDKYASQVLSVDMKTLGTYAKDKENRIYSNYNDLSPYIVHALIATEDVRFTKHSGIDAIALLRAVVKRGILMQPSGGGGSTISQQLAKQLYSPGVENLMERLFQKPIEWVIAVQLERFYTKEEIINMYLNKFDFLYNAVGIQSAAWVYFGKKPKDLNLEEAATLIGMCKNPSYYDPIRRKERTQGRRNVVISLMEKNGYITKAESDLAKNKPLVISYNKVDHKDGLAPYLREYLRMTMTAKKPDRKNYMAWERDRYTRDSLAWEINPLFGWCNKNKKNNGNGPNYNLYTDGLKIYTAIDSRMQKYAEDAVREHVGLSLQEDFFRGKKGSKTAPFSRNLSDKDYNTIMERAMRQSERYRVLKKADMNEKDIRKVFDTPIDMTVFSWKGLKDTTMTPMDSIRYMKFFLRAGFMVMDPRNGAVKAYVGGTDYQHFQYDMINMGRRQVGSTIKPFLYSLAMEEGFTPCDEMLHVEQHLVTEDGTPYNPRNSNKKRIGEMVTLKWGLQNSDNWVSAYLMQQLSPYGFAKLLHSYGLMGQIDPVISLCLGSCDASIGEMVTGYSAFANRGIRAEPVYVTRIEDNYGNVLATFTPKITDVISEDAAFKMLDMMRAVVDGGTAIRLRYRYGLTAPMGAKTGTSQNHSDGWFMGFTPSLVGGAWVGGEDRDIHFDRMDEGQAAATALPIFALFLKKVFEDPNLGYSQTEIFEVTGKDPCASYSEKEGVIKGIDEIFN
ncbi:MAG: transglycosylase domain-containing protein [Dysgonamonadaceae bacterium]|jgi:penicillin-binding protein 1A|nr:transglycosylase domain-containing protein [Dysgonamonadaceae bacterium]